MEENYENPDICSSCGNLPQDILMLACNHDLCLDCSAKLFCKQKDYQIQSFVKISFFHNNEILGISLFNL